jgi:hypothetical protein
VVPLNPIAEVVYQVLAPLFSRFPHIDRPGLSGAAQRDANVRPAGADGGD